MRLTGMFRRISNSLFIDSGAVVASFSDNGYVHNITAIRQRTL
jgi:hypothetical protein